jgi:spermidine/putrescine-binding protein
MKLVRTLTAALLIAFPFVQAAAQSRELVIYTWEDMFPQKILDDFQKETGIKVKLEYFEYNDEMYEQLKFTNGAEFDLIIADDYIVDIVIREGLAQKLNKSKLGSFGNINPLYQHQFYDPKDEYTVPYGAGVQTIVYDPAKIKKNITGYADLWDSSLKNSVGIIGNYRVVNGMALKTLGKSYNTENLADIRAAGTKLKALAPNIRLIRDTGLEEDLLAGKISAAVMYTDQVMKSTRENPGLKVVFPREGIGFGIMPAFIPKQAPNADGAHRFLNYILDPVRGARCFEHLGYYCTYKASEAHLRADLKKVLVLPQEIKNYEMIWNLTLEAENEHAQIWGDFSSAIRR